LGHFIREMKENEELRKYRKDFHNNSSFPHSPCSPALYALSCNLHKSFPAS
jgi:hypothetical protein